MSTPGRHRPPCVSTSTAVRAARLGTLEEVLLEQPAFREHSGHPTPRKALCLACQQRLWLSAFLEVLTSRNCAAPRPPNLLNPHRLLLTPSKPNAASLISQSTKLVDASKTADREFKLKNPRQPRDLFRSEQVVGRKQRHQTEGRRLNKSASDQAESAYILLPWHRKRLLVVASHLRNAMLPQRSLTTSASARLGHRSRLLVGGPPQARQLPTQLQEPKARPVRLLLF